MLVQAEIDCGTADVQIEVASGKSGANINSAEGLWELLGFLSGPRSTSDGLFDRDRTDVSPPVGSFNATCMVLLLQQWKKAALVDKLKDPAIALWPCSK